MDYLFHAPDDSILQHYFDAVGMVRRLRKDSLDDTFGKLSRPLVLLLNHPHLHARFDVRSVLAVHFDN